MTSLRWACALLVGASAGCATPPEAERCPAPLQADGRRARALLERLRSRPEGDPIVARLRGRSPTICFGDPPFSAVTTDGVILMQSRLTEREAAARLGHLLVHVIEGLPMERPGPGSCEQQVDEALGAEARALAVEIRLRRALDVGPDPALRYEFEAPFWQAAPDAREPVILHYLREHPDGGPGVDALASAYRQRCRSRKAP